MIKDSLVKSEILKDWRAVRKLHDMPSDYPVGFLNLALLLAYSVLDQVLRQAIVEGKFNCDPRATLGEKMKKSRPNISWVNYDVVKQGKKARNDLAHEGEVASIANCRKFIAAIEAELRAWSL
jgi:hypothetical protein